jgi:hypothetical protein
VELHVSLENSERNIELKPLTENSSREKLLALGKIERADSGAVTILGEAVGVAGELGAGRARVQGNKLTNIT